MKLNKKLLISFLASIFTFSGTFAAGIDHFEVKFSPDAAKVGEALDLSIDAVDKNNETVLDYKGTILIFSETDPEAILPSALEENTYTFKASDQGMIKFENGVIFKKAGLEDIHIYDLDDDTIYGIAEAQISEDTTIKNLDISIASPEDGVTIGQNSVSVSGLTQKNYKVKIVVNGKDEFQTASNDEGVYEKTVDTLIDGENTIKAIVIDADGNEVGESKEIKIKVESDNLGIKSVKVNPDSVNPESSYEVEVIANPSLPEVSIVVDDTITKLNETSEGVYTEKLLSPKNPGTYKVDVKIKDDLGHEKTELGASSVTVIELKSAPVALGNTGTTVSTGAVDCGENIDYKITGLKLVELKTKSILTWDKIDGVDSYNIYKKLEDGKFELVENVTDSRFEVEITGDEVKYDYFGVKAVAKNKCEQSYEGSLSEATKVKTGPEVLILFIISILIGGFFMIRRKDA